MNADNMGAYRRIEGIHNSVYSARQFFGTARSHIEHRGLSELFGQLAQVYERSALRLQPFVGLTDVDKTSAQELDSHYARILSEIQDKPDSDTVSQLASLNGVLRDEVNDVLVLDLSLSVLAALTDLRRELKLCHDRLTAAQRISARVSMSTI